MLEKICSILITFAFAAAALIYAKKYGAKSAQLEAEKERILNEAKQRQKANQIISNVTKLSDNSVDDRLQNIASSKRK